MRALLLRLAGWWRTGHVPAAPTYIEPSNCRVITKEKAK